MSPHKGEGELGKIWPIVDPLHISGMAEGLEILLGCRKLRILVKTMQK